MPKSTLNLAFSPISPAYEACVLIHYTKMYGTSCVWFSSVHCCCFPIIINVCFLFISFFIPSLNLCFSSSNYHIIIYFSVSLFLILKILSILHSCSNTVYMNFHWLSTMIACPSLRASFKDMVLNAHRLRKVFCFDLLTYIQLSIHFVARKFCDFSSFNHFTKEDS